MKRPDRMLRAGLFLCAVAVAAWAGNTHALIFTLSGAPARQLHLQVGSGGDGVQFMQNNPTIDVMSVTVPAAQVGSGSAQTFATSNPNTIDPFPPVALTCTSGSNVLISAIARVPGTTAITATLTVNSAAPLSSGAQTLPFSQISWTTSDTSIPAGTFNNTAAQTLLTFQTSRQYENCHTFSYSNTNVVAAGTYQGRVTYTLSMP